MASTVGIGIQDFEQIRERNVFYVDKTEFIREWWESSDNVTLITRPGRFGKTLNLSMVECFFSVKYKDRGGTCLRDCPSGRMRHTRNWRGHIRS